MQIYNIIYYCWFLFNTLKEKVSHLGKKHLSKQVFLQSVHCPENGNTVSCENLSHLKRQKERGGRGGKTQIFVLS